MGGVNPRGFLQCLHIPGVGYVITNTVAEAPGSFRRAVCGRARAPSVNPGLKAVQEKSRLTCLRGGEAKLCPSLSVSRAQGLCLFSQL